MTTHKDEIIHGLNNALTVIVGNLELLIETEKFDMECCVAAKKGTDRIIKIMKMIREECN